jgi:hypothetical protein
MVKKIKYFRQIMHIQVRSLSLFSRQMTKTMVQRTKRANKIARFFVCKHSEFKALFQGFHCFGSILGSIGIIQIIPLSPPSLAESRNKKGAFSAFFYFKISS